MLASPFTSPIRCNKSAVKSESEFPAFLKHLNTNNLALSLFVALALLTGTRGKESVETSRCKEYNRDSVIIHDSAFSPDRLTLPHAQEAACFRQKFKASSTSSKQPKLTLSPFTLG
jgi:hypothetical protein